MLEHQIQPVSKYGNGQNRKYYERITRVASELYLGVVHKCRHGLRGWDQVLFTKALVIKSVTMGGGGGVIGGKKRPK